MIPRSSQPFGTIRLMPLGQHPLSVTEESLELPGQPYTARLCIDIASLRQHHARSAPYPHVALTRLNTNASIPAKTVPHKTLSFTLRHAFTTGGPPPSGDIMYTYKLSPPVSTEQGVSRRAWWRGGGTPTLI